MLSAVHALVIDQINRSPEMQRIRRAQDRRIAKEHAYTEAGRVKIAAAEAKRARRRERNLRLARQESA
jgi:hypothetical protein